MSLLGPSVNVLDQLSRRDFQELMKAANSLLSSLVREIRHVEKGKAISRKWPNKPPIGFVCINNDEEKQLVITTQTKPCVRCGTIETVSNFQSVLNHFVCTFCFKDANDWSFKGKGECIPYTVIDMQYQTPEVHIPDGKGGYINQTSM